MTPARYGILLLAAATSWAAGPAPLSPQALRGREVLERAECHRCHDVTDVTDVTGTGRGAVRVPLSRHCIRCHAQIDATKSDPAASERFRARYPEWDRYQRNVRHFVAVPDLGTLTRRVDPRFVRRYLDAPFDLRPHMEETMVPVRLGAEEKDAVVAYLTALNAGHVARLPEKTPEISPERVAAGRERFASGPCPSCHLYGNVRFDPHVTAELHEQMKPVARLAPNLRFVRERIPRDVLARWIVDPRSVSPTAAMYEQKVTRPDAELIADFLLAGDFEADARPAPVAVPAVPLLDRPVGFEEVFDSVLGGACMHCHMDPSESQDGGPGNTGGLGFAGIRLNLAHHAGVRAGLVRDGKPASILEPGPGGEPPLLLGALLRRHAEASRDLRRPFADRIDLGTGPGERPGMPLGLPPLPVEQMALVKTWLAQGAPGPSEAWEKSRRERVERGGLMPGVEGARRKLHQRKNADR